MIKTKAPVMFIANQRGMALISSLLLLLVVSLMAVGVSMDTSMDVRIAAYQSFIARSFGFAESGLMASTDILEDNIAEVGWDASAGDIEYPNKSTAYVGNIKIKQDHGTFYMDENSAGDTILEMTNDIQADIVVQRMAATLGRGGAMQVAAGYAGIGKGMGGGGSFVIYDIQSTGTDADQCQTCLAIHYRHVTK